MYTVSRILLMLALASLFRIDGANAQTIPKSLQWGGSDAAIKERKNAWTVGIAGGIIDGTYMRFADEVAKVLDDGDNLRILPMVSYGAASNLDDLLYLRGVDLAVTQSDVFEYFRTERKTPNLQNRVHYILRLPIAELHILAKTDIHSLEDLRGKKVNFGPAGSGSSLTGTIVFQRLGVQVEQVLIDQQSALQKLQSGEVAALVRVIGKPVDFFARIPPNSGLHLVPIPFSKTFADYYTLGEFETKDYPSLIAEGQKVDTIAVPAVLAVFNWPRGSTDTAASNASSSGSSPTGTNSWSRPVIPSGVTSIWAPRFRVGPGTSSPSKCSNVSMALRYRLKRISVAISGPS
jgi:TRAP-type uncharacterized transport system substrate-binding protein